LDAEAKIGNLSLRLADCEFRLKCWRIAAIIGLTLNAVLSAVQTAYKWGWIR
jgi:hypothetical protein